MPIITKASDTPAARTPAPFPAPIIPWANARGILTTASDLLFVGGREGYFQSLDAKTGTLLWKQNLGGEIIAGPISYLVDGKQYVSIASGNGLFTFALRE